MTDTHETIADIIAWLRRPRGGENAYLTLWRDEIADRLEAAHKRERGDAAKLREALELIVNERGILDFCHNNLGSKTLDDWDKVYKIIRRWIDKAMSALAAPPRNCDKVKTSWDVLKKWHEGLDTANDIVRMLDWLLAPATEQEGGNDGNE